MGVIVFCVIAYFVISYFIKNVSSSEGVSNCCCPYCKAKYSLKENGDFSCSNCGKIFRYRNGVLYKAEERLPLVLELLCSLFTIMCKADGVVSENEVILTRKILKRDFSLGDREINLATNILNKDKNKIYNIDLLYKLNKIFNEYNFNCDDVTAYKESILCSSMALAFCDNNLSEKQNSIINDMVRVFSISNSKYLELLNYFKGRYSEKENRNYCKDDKEAYYKTLGLSPYATKEEVKSAFRRLSKLYHPDRYISKDLPPEIIKDFEDKLSKIIEAYEALK